MLLIDDLLLLPVSGLRFIFRTLHKVAEDEWTDDAPIKKRLLELQLELESGEMTEKQYVKKEAAILRELREVERRKRALAGLPPEHADRGLVFRGRGQDQAEASVTLHQDRERKSR
jgi:gas vesicle protein GvpG